MYPTYRGLKGQELDWGRRIPGPHLSEASFAAAQQQEQSDFDDMIVDMATPSERIACRGWRGCSKGAREMRQ